MTEDVDADWYLADLVIEIRVEGDWRNVVHINTHLVRAASDEEALKLARALGAETDADYTNELGQAVTWRFRGLRELVLIHDDLEDGAELAYTERVAVAEDEVQGLVRDRASLAVFRPPQEPTGPNYADGGIVAETEKLIRGDLDE